MDYILIGAYLSVHSCLYTSTMAWYEIKDDEPDEEDDHTLLVMALRELRELKDEVEQLKEHVASGNAGKYDIMRLDNQGTCGLCNAAQV